MVAGDLAGDDCSDAQSELMQYISEQARLAWRLREAKLLERKLRLPFPHGIPLADVPARLVEAIDQVNELQVRYDAAMAEYREARKAVRQRFAGEQQRLFDPETT